MYTPLPYFIAKTVVDIPLQAIMLICFTSVMYARAHSCSSHNTNSPNPSLPPSLTTHLPTPSQRYPMVGLNPDGVLTFILALFVTCLAAQSVGLCMGASLNDERLIAVVAPVRAALHASTHHLLSYQP